MWMKTVPVVAFALAAMSCTDHSLVDVRGDAAGDASAEVAGEAAAEVPAGVENRLVFTGDGGKAIQFSREAQLRVFCGPWDPETAPVKSVQILLGGPRDEDPAWQVQAVFGDITPGVALGFPNSFHFQNPKGALVFAHDGTNEASTAEEGSSGSLTFQSISCDEGGTVAFTLDAVLGSELADLGPITAKGTFRGVVGPAPTPDPAP